MASLRLNSSSSGVSRSHHGTSRVGVGGTTAAGGTIHRGMLTKLSGPSSSSGGSRVPLPVNTSSLRKENGGQDITAVIVNRSGDKKAVWGSALTEKAEETKASASTPTPLTTSAPKPTPTTNNPNSIRLDPTPEEAAYKSSPFPPGETLRSSDGGNGGPALNKNTPWAIHPPPSQHRDRNDYPPSDHYNHPPPREEHNNRNYDRGYHSYNRDMDGGNSYYNQRSRYDDRHRSPTHPSDRYHYRNDRYDDSRYGDRPHPPPYHGDFDSDPHSRRYSGGGGGGGGFDRGYNNRRPPHSRYHDSNTRYNDRYHRSEDRHGEERTLYNPNTRDHGESGGLDSEMERGGPSRFRTSGPLYGSSGGMDSNRHASGEYDRSERDNRTTSRFFGERPSAGPSVRDDRNGFDYRSRPYSREPVKDLLSNEKGNSNEEQQKPIHEPELLPNTEPRRILRSNDGTGSGPVNWAEDSDSESDEYLSESSDESDDEVKEEPKVLLKLSKETPAPRLLDEAIPINPEKKIVSGHETELRSSGSTVQTLESTSEEVPSRILAKPAPVEEPILSNEERRLLQQQNILRQVQAKRKQRDRAKSNASEETVERITSQQAPEEPTPTENSEEVDEAAKELAKKNREKFLALRAAERAARAEHRRTRKARTNGVLWRRLPDGSLVNADLSEEEIARRAEKKLSRENKKLGKASNSKHSKAKKQSHADESEKEITESKIPPKKKEFVPAPKPSVSAWVSGPPPSMAKKEEMDKKSASIERKQIKQIEPDTIIGNPTASTSLDDVLSASLLNPSWSAPAPIQQPKVAVGPIMSSWTAFGNGHTDFNYSSYGTTKPDNGHVPPGADWNMDFALPHDLLSNAAESEEEIKPTEKVNEAKDQSKSKRNKRSKGRGQPNRRKTHISKNTDPGKQHDKKSSKSSNQSKRPRRPYSKAKKAPKDKPVSSNPGE